MELWNVRTFKSILLPGGAIFLGAVLLLNTGWVPLPIPGVNFFFYAVVIATILLSFRFRSTRIFFCALVLFLVRYALENIGNAVGRGSAQPAFEFVSLLLPLDFAVLTFFPERSSDRRVLWWIFGALFLESTFVAVFSRPDQPAVSVFHFSLINPYHLRLPQPALLVFVVAAVLILVRLVQFQKAIDHGMLWSLIATAAALETGGAGRLATVYFGVAGFILASAVIENSYSLAYRDELTGLNSRRSFNDALLRLKPPYAIAAVDIDHFKSINDTYGHDTGDQVLRLVASRLARIGTGEAFRVGGEEFTILFPGKLAKDVGEQLELLRMDIESSSFRIRTGEERRKVPRQTDAERRAGNPPKPAIATRAATQEISVTVSIGVAESQLKLRTEEVIQQADKALYRAKKGGRNRIELATVVRKARKTAKARKSGL